MHTVIPPSTGSLGSRDSDRGGFVLIATISLLVLLALIAVGLLTLSTVQVRSASLGDYRKQAEANARLALMLALGDLQKQLGPDGRITANASIKSDSGLRDLVGVWESWSPRLREDLNSTAPDYDQEKEDRFLGWLSSHPDVNQLEDDGLPVRGWGEEEAVALFEEEKDGIDLSAPFVELQSGRGQGRYAWAVVQENTKAQLLPADNNLAKTARRPRNSQNDFLMVPPLTGVDVLDPSFNDDYREQEDDLVQASAKMVTQGQVEVNKELVSGSYARETTFPHYTTNSYGVLSDVVAGELKKDLSLAFELPDAVFEKEELNDRPNPFRGDDPRLGASTRNTGGERSLYQRGRASRSGRIQFRETYRRLDTPFDIDQFILSGNLPTYDTLRSHYRLYKHLYQSGGGVTAYERSSESPLWTGASFTRLAGKSGAGSRSQTSLAPVLDRTLIFHKIGVSSDRRLQVILTPVVTLWNPYNVALECEGYLVLPLYDYPVLIWWTIGSNPRHLTWLSGMLSYANRGRSTYPYFLLRLTSDGTGNTSNPIRFEPGEVKVFDLAETELQRYENVGRDNLLGRTYEMKPASSNSGLGDEGGILLDISRPGPFNSGGPYRAQLTNNQRVSAEFFFDKQKFKYYLNLEDFGRLEQSGPANRTRGEVVTSVQVFENGSISLAEQTVRVGNLTVGELQREPYPVAVLETFHRTVAGLHRSDLAYTANPRQPYVNPLLSGSDFTTSPHYDSNFRATRVISDVLETSGSGRSFYGVSNSASSGSDYIPLFDVPQQPMLSLASFQHLDCSNTPFATSYQIGNSWASPYIDSGGVYEYLREAQVDSPEVQGNTIRLGAGVDFYDYSYLMNEALWDSVFLSSLAPSTTPGSGGGGIGAHSEETVVIERSLEETIRDFVADPVANPLRNGRYHLHTGGVNQEELINKLRAEDGLYEIAAHLLVSGAFNVNSTSVEAWAAVLASTYGVDFEMKNPQTGRSNEFKGEKASIISRQHTPVATITGNGTGEPNDPMTGVRTLSKGEIQNLAEEVVEQVKERGPFLSLAEFVNRRVGSGPGPNGAHLRGMLQAAIDESDLNSNYLFEQLADKDKFRFSQNISLDRTGIGAPGYVTQADLLQPLAPFITVRSDTFVVRTYGEARDRSGNVQARAWCEAVVQRIPDLVDSTEPASTSAEDMNEVNKRFGRRFQVVSFRFLSPSEAPKIVQG